MLFRSVYAISQRKEKIAKQEQDEAVQTTKTLATEEMNSQLSKQKDKMDKEREAAVNNGIKKALADAAAAKKAEEQKAEAAEAKIAEAEAAKTAEQASPDEAVTDDATDPESSADDSIQGEE